MEQVEQCSYEIDQVIILIDLYDVIIKVVRLEFIYVNILLF